MVPLSLSLLYYLARVLILPISSLSMREILNHLDPFAKIDSKPSQIILPEGGGGRARTPNSVIALYEAAVFPARAIINLLVVYSAEATRGHLVSNPTWYQHARLDSAWVKAQSLSLSLSVLVWDTSWKLRHRVATPTGYSTTTGHLYGSHLSST